MRSNLCIYINTCPVFILESLLSVRSIPINRARRSICLVFRIRFTENAGTTAQPTSTYRMVPRGPSHRRADVLKQRSSRPLIYCFIYTNSRSLRTRLTNLRGTNLTFQCDGGPTPTPTRRPTPPPTPTVPDGVRNPRDRRPTLRRITRRLLVDPDAPEIAPRPRTGGEGKREARGERERGGKRGGL